MQTIKMILLSVAVIFAPIKAALITAGLLITVDLITGILAARKRGEAITSSKLRRTLSKMCIFEAVILLAFLLEKYLMDGVLPMAKIASAYVGIVEYKSILENLNQLNGESLLSGLIKKLNKKEEDEK